MFKLVQMKEERENKADCMFTVGLMIVCRFQGTARSILSCPATNKKPRVA